MCVFSNGRCRRNGSDNFLCLCVYDWPCRQYVGHLLSYSYFVQNMVCFNNKSDPLSSRYHPPLVREHGFLDNGFSNLARLRKFSI